MQQELRNRSVMIRTQNGEVIGTGVVIDSQHILTCAHVVFEAVDSDSHVTPTTPIYFLPIGKSVKEVQIAHIVHSQLIEESTETTGCRYLFPDFPDDFEDAQRCNFDYTEDLILLKSKLPLLSVPPIHWQSPPDDEKAEGFGFRNEVGEEFVVTLKGERALRLFECQFVHQVGELNGASGTALLDVSNTGGDFLCAYGMITADSKQNTGETRRAYFISGGDIQLFIASYFGTSAEPFVSNQADRIQAKALDWLSHDYTFSLIDRHFLSHIEVQLAQQGLVCSTFFCCERDWFNAIGLRVTQPLALLQRGSKRTQSVNITWPAYEAGTQSDQILQEVITSILKGLCARVSLFQLTNSQEYIDNLHETLGHFDRVAIGIKLRSSSLFPSQQNALQQLISEMQMYRKSNGNQSKTEILLYLVVDKNTCELPRFARLKFWNRPKPVEQITQNIDKTYLCWLKHKMTLELIEDSHLDEWINTLCDLSNSEQRIFESLKNHAQQLLDVDGGLQHRTFRNKLKQKLSSAVTE